MKIKLSKKREIVYTLFGNKKLLKNIANSITINPNGYDTTVDMKVFHSMINTDTLSISDIIHKVESLKYISTISHIVVAYAIANKSDNTYYEKLYVYDTSIVSLDDIIREYYSIKKSNKRSSLFSNIVIIHHDGTKKYIMKNNSMKKLIELV